MSTLGWGDLASKDNEIILTAPAPPAVTEGGHYGPGVYAHDIVCRCDFSLPHHRLGKMLGLAGYKISRSTLCDLFHRAAELLKPIYDRLFEITRNDRYVSADETGLAIQAEGKCKKKVSCVSFGNIMVTAVRRTPRISVIIKI